MLVACLFAVLFGAIEPACSKEDDRQQAPLHKSYVLAGGGALICPVVGHAYIGGDNIRRGAWYTVSEVSYGVLAIAAALGGVDKYAYRNFAWLIATHTISFTDAMLSVHRIHNPLPTKSLFIATGGAVVFPVIGHSYIGGKNRARGWLYSFAQVVFTFEGHPDISHGIKYISMLDAYVSAVKYNQSITHVSFVPTASSCRLAITKTF